MQLTIRTAKAPIQANVIIPGSKNIAYRAIILSALADGVCEISGLQVSENIKLLIAALRELGIVTQLDEASRYCIIAGGNGKLPKKQATLWCHDSLTLSYLLMAICSATSGVYYFDGSASLRERPLTFMMNTLSRQGIQFIPGDSQKMPFTLVGADTLEGGEVILDHTANQHIASALLMIAPFARSPFTFTLHETVNQSHIDMTCAMMAEFGVLVHRIHQRQLMVPVPQRYHAKDYVVEPDFAIAAYFFAAAAVTGGEITIQPVKLAQSKQPNAKFLTILEKMGCRIRETKTGLTLSGPAQLQGIEVSMRDFADTFLALAAIAPFAKSPVRISHLGPLRQKEKSRMTAMKTELTKMGIQVETGEDWIKIFPGSPLGGVINTHADARIAMAAAIIGLKAPGVIIDDAKYAEKTCPEFFSLWEKLAEPLNISA
ncbi:3-phosphoshikimate 1-carboxyvinyltransferase [Aquicella lusitana]|uniref:3-phosphoshikimate 1-carboxyvinyltransferase n=1 Tax=Aquicella lusitana TaxID=254246 RepID=A0A370GFH2_9COXI|nr:3-phosphoshikimate 1-carboxyvinyltransferase [Aquicella lusitana]RDI42437.1 3-phosphoshikimate 1-carboxyvinyltransferase [Aquicella lusitana]VVC74101.1 3-phosphoshikimate 1-carboxyvinyltransferase [Aquicella lusitana]